MYGTLAEADAYHAARGRADWINGNADARAAALVRGSDYVDGAYRGGPGCTGATFPGRKTEGRAQEREWPRTGARDASGEQIPDDEVPREVEHAAYEAAYREHQEPGSLSPDYVPATLVTKEKVGPIEIGYAAPQGGGGNPLRPVVTVIDEILAPVLFKRFCGPGVRVV